ncbi:uncharacterized protein LOC124266623 isoform X2 [Haliotis rubra]|uniref:uncharacterized protein LOC124266623 isoform X2 n=1 Tax=Haliotis rubra TaxID=36100 RepID=UPI001EE5BF8D|nr:uncharacterized protein LOC124266623 isoform X2 [Haliotis rubra]
MSADHSYSVLFASKDGNEAKSKEFKDFDNVISEFMKDQGIPGLALIISFHGNVIYKQGYGMAGVNRPVTSSSRFRIASISKPLTAIGLMRLVEQGQLTLDDKVFGPKGILKEFKPSAKGDKRVLQITVRHLLHHSAGWDRDQAGDPVFFNLDAIDAKHGVVSPISDQFNVKLVKFMMTRKLQFAPGKRHAYSNFGFLVLGLVLERITQMKYETFMRTIFLRMGLHRLRVGFTKRILCDTDEVEYFNNRDPAILKSLFPNEGLVLPQYGSFSMENTGAYGGWVASVGDLLAVLHSLQRVCGDENSVGSIKYTQGPDPKSCQTPPGRKERLQSWHQSTSNIDVKPIDHDGQSARQRDADGMHNEADVKRIKFCHRYVKDSCFTYEDSAPRHQSEVEICECDTSQDCDADMSHSCLECQTFTPFGVPIQDKYPPLNSYCEFESQRNNWVNDDTAGNADCKQKESLDSPNRECLLEAFTVAEMLARPGCQNGNQWYGLGLDVQDCGTSFGHTGAMEGSCGTMMHHKSGFSWVMLMNSWSRDMDLDGLVKYALSTVKGYPLYYEADEDKNIHEINSQDDQEKVLLLVPLPDVQAQIAHAESAGFMLTWINASNIDMKVYFNLIFRQSITRWSVYFDIDDDGFSVILQQEENRDRQPVLIESYTKDDKIFYCILFHESTDHNQGRIVSPIVPAKVYLKLISEKRASGMKVTCQSASVSNGDIYVSSIFRNTDEDTDSWLQITPEEFLVEQQRQMKKSRDLKYVKFYSLGEEPFVSALWTTDANASNRYQRYGASKYGLLQELREAASRNLRLQSCSSYMSDGVLNFAAVWNPSDV